MLFHVWHSSVFFFTSLYLRRILWRIPIVFALHTKSPKQWKYDVWHHRFQKNLRFTLSHETDKLASWKTPLWDPFLIPGNTVYVWVGKLTGEKRPVPYQKYPVTCGLGLRWAYEACFVTRPLVVSTWNSPYSYPSPCIDQYYLKLSANNRSV